ncbi:hypothetical protein ACHHYP_13791 [Achlya hypogyna]|uniref:Uncharacterized protein n=1 Tax=Achlya hypogyna TaxID=1202772 RepID=A0A1V9YEH8_ACHHY|nr:hypothetical protein ACHHYP_13791 [Achlya hypogyna]
MADPRPPALVVVDVHRVAYSDVPTPQEVALSRELLALQADRDALAAKFQSEIVHLETQLHAAAVREGELLQRLQAVHIDQVEHEQVAVHAERAAWAGRLEAMQAEVQKQKHEQRAREAWHTRFSEHMATGAPATEADSVFSRFAETIALLPAYEAPLVARAGSLAFLANVLRETQVDTVVGPVLVALTHVAIARDDDLRHAIVLAGALPPLLHTVETSGNPAVLAAASSLLAALATAPANKTPLAAKPTVKALARLVASPAATPLVLASALAALVNLAHGMGYRSDVLRSQVVNSDVVPIVSRVLGEVSDVGVQVEAARLLCNVAFAGVSNQATVLMAQGDAELIARLRAVPGAATADAERQLQRGAALGVANLAATPAGQIALGYSDASTSCLQLLVDATHPPVLEACGLAIAALCYQCKVNKVRIAAQNGLHVCVYVLGDARRFGADEAVLAATCLAVATLVLTDANLRTFDDLDGPALLVSLCLRASSRPLLEASAMAVAALAPTPNHKFKVLSCGKELPVERAGGLAALERAAFSLFSQHDASLPAWLEMALDVLRASFAQLRARVEERALDDDATNPKSDETESLLPELFPRALVTRQVTAAVRPDPLCTDYYKPAPT